MPTTYQRKPPVICFNCGDSMVKRRTSRSGRYYCPKPDCQAERRKDWLADRVSPQVRELQDKARELSRMTAAFITASLAAKSGGATCPECGFTNAPLGWAHFNAEGGGCGGLGLTAGRVDINVVEAMFPAAERVYVDV